MITANGCRRDWVTGNAATLYLDLFFFLIFTASSLIHKADILARHVTGFLDFSFQCDLFLSNDTSLSSVESVLLTSKGGGRGAVVIMMMMMMEGGGDGDDKDGNGG